MLKYKYGEVATDIIIRSVNLGGERNMKNLAKVIGGGFIYPFRNIGMLIIPFLMAFVVYGGLMYIMFDRDILALAEGRFGSFPNILMNVLLILIIMIAVMPFLVAIVRNVVLGEKMEPMVIKNLLGKRELSVVFGFLKLVIGMFIPFIAAAAVFSVIEGIEFMRMGGQVSAMAQGEVATVSWIGSILFLLGLLFSLIVLARGSLIFVTGSLDRGVSLRNSFAISKHHTGLALLAVVGVLGVTLLLLWIIFHILGMFGFVIHANDLMTLSHGGQLVLSAIVAFVRLLLAVIYVAVFAKLYMIITSQK